jgi:uncharacterized membrane protein YjdF
MFDFFGFWLSIRSNGKEFNHDCGSANDVWHVLNDHFDKVVGVLMAVII